MEVTLRDETKKAGKLVAVNDDTIEIEYKEGKNKKAVVKQEIIVIETIKQIKVQIKF